MFMMIVTPIRTSDVRVLLTKGRQNQYLPPGHKRFAHEVEFTVLPIVCHSRNHAHRRQLVFTAKVEEQQCKRNGLLRRPISRNAPAKPQEKVSGTFSLS